jgi:hypothetical protein
MTNSVESIEVNVCYDTERARGVGLAELRKLFESELGLAPRSSRQGRGRDERLGR